MNEKGFTLFRSVLLGGVIVIVAFAAHLGFEFGVFFGNVFDVLNAALEKDLRALDIPWDRISF